MGQLLDGQSLWLWQPFPLHVEFHEGLELLLDDALVPLCFVNDQGKDHGWAEDGLETSQRCRSHHLRVVSPKFLYGGHACGGLHISHTRDFLLSHDQSVSPRRPVCDIQTYHDHESAHR